MAHEDADVQVAALVAGARERDVAEADAGGAGAGREGDGRGGVVGVARAERRVGGRVAGRVGGGGFAGGAGDEVGGFGEAGLRPEGWVEGEVGFGGCGAPVEGAVVACRAVSCVWVGCRGWWWWVRSLPWKCLREMLLTAGASFLRAASERDWATMRMYMVLLFWSHGFSAGTPMLMCFH